MGNAWRREDSRVVDRVIDGSIADSRKSIVDRVGGGTRERGPEDGAGLRL